MSSQTPNMALTAKLNKYAFRQISMLTVQFLLGMAASFIGTDAKGATKVVGATVVALHIAVAIGLVIVAGLLVRTAEKVSETAKRVAFFGVGIIIATFVAGVLSLKTGSNWWSYAMSVGFMAAILLYGKLYVDSRSVIR